MKEAQITVNVQPHSPDVTKVLLETVKEFIKERLDEGRYDRAIAEGCRLFLIGDTLSIHLDVNFSPADRIFFPILIEQGIRMGIKSRQTSVEDYEVLVR